MTERSILPPAFVLKRKYVVHLSYPFLENNKNLLNLLLKLS